MKIIKLKLPEPHIEKKLDQINQLMGGKDTGKIWAVCPGCGESGLIDKLSDEKPDNIFVYAGCNNCDPNNVLPFYTINKQGEVVEEL